MIEAIKLLLAELRPQIVSLVESIGFPDEFLTSAIGNSYGDIYETHLNWAQNSRLNQTEDAIPDGYLKYITPILNAKM